MPRKSLFLIDGSAIAYRSYFAFLKNPLTNSKGQNTSAVFGFLRFLFMIYDNESPDYLAVVFDPKGPTFRHEQYKEYKATRQKMPDDMSDQIPLIHEAIDALNIARIEVPGFEADDVIGTLARQAKEQDFETFLVTGDKDFMQLVDEHVRMYNPKRANEPVEILDARGVEEKVGVPPAKIVDYLGLMGDTSDNVPGVRGVGGKTALKLIQEFGSLEGALENADKVSRANVRANLQTYREEALLSKKLVTIDTHVDTGVDIASLRCVPPDHERIVKLIKEMEFPSLLNRFSAGKTPAEVEFVVVDSLEKMQRLFAELQKAGQFAFELVASGDEPLRAELVGIAFASGHGKAHYLPVLAQAGKLLLRTEGDLFGGGPLAEHLARIFENGEIVKFGHNLKEAILILGRFGIGCHGLSLDTMLASYLLNPSLRQHNLDAVALEHLNRTRTPLEELLGKGRNKLALADVEVAKLAKRASEDADIIWQLSGKLQEQLQKEGLTGLLHDLELPLTEVLADMERLGVSLDLPFLEKMSNEIGARVDELVAKVYDLAGEEFNINSTQQLGEILFDKLHLPRKKRTKTGYSTDAKVLEELAKLHDLPRALLEYRELTKLKSTYVDALPSLVNPETGRLHTSYNQTVAATGRLSSSNPNLQNIPIRTDLGREIRRAFVPRDSTHVIVDADYSQIELRVMAHLSQDPVLLEAFRNDEDIHTKTACLIFQIDPEDLEHEHRRRAKEINFGIMYGMGVFGLATRLNISHEEARVFIDSYFALYQKVHEFIDRMHAQVEEHGFVTTLLNRRRFLPEIRSKNRNIREFAKRTAVNTPIQGTAAELIKIAMIKIWRRLREGDFKTRMIMQVHDELVFEAPASEVEEVKALVCHEMENALPLDVPIKAEIGVGANWLEAH